MNSRIPKSGYEAHEYYKNALSKGKKEDQVIMDLVHTFYPSLKAPYVLETEVKEDDWKVAVKLPMQGKAHIVGTIMFCDFVKDDRAVVPRIYFSNDVIEEMALKNKSLEETGSEKVDSKKKDPQSEALEFLKKYKRVEQWFSSDLKEDNLLKTLMKQPHNYKIQEFDIEEELSSTESAGMTRSFVFLVLAPIAIFLGAFGFGVLGGGGQSLFSGLLLGAAGSIVVGGLIAAGVCYVLNNIKIQEFKDLASCAKALSPKAVQLLTQTDAPAVVQQEKVSNASQDFRLPVYSGQNDDLDRPCSHNDLTNPFVVEYVVNAQSFSSPLTQSAPPLSPYYGDDWNNPFVSQELGEDWLGLKPVYIANPPK